MNPNPARPGQVKLAEMYRLFNELHSEALECRDAKLHGVLLDKMESIVENAKRLTLTGGSK